MLGFPKALPRRVIPLSTTRPPAAATPELFSFLWLSERQRTWGRVPSANSVVAFGPNVSNWAVCGNSRETEVVKTTTKKEKQKSIHTVKRHAALRKLGSAIFFQIYFLSWFICINISHARFGFSPFLDIGLHHRVTVSSRLHLFFITNWQWNPTRGLMRSMQACM